MQRNRARTNAAVVHDGMRTRRMVAVVGLLARVVMAVLGWLNGLRNVVMRLGRGYSRRRCLLGMRDPMQRRNVRHQRPRKHAQHQQHHESAVQGGQGEAADLQHRGSVRQQVDLP